jgi:sortase (surface protein transpeptidase)
MQLAQMQQQQQQQQQQQAGSSQQQQQQQQQQQPAATQQQQQDRLGGVAVDISNSFRNNDPVYAGLEPSPSTNSTGTGKVRMLLILTSLVPSCFAHLSCKD